MTTARPHPLELARLHAEPPAVRAERADPLARPPVRWALGFGVWTLMAVLSACQSAIFLADIGRPVEWDRLLISRLADWYTCAIFTPAIFWVVRRYPIDRDRWPITVPVQIGATAVFVALKYAIYYPLSHQLGVGRFDSLQAMVTANFITEFIAFAAVVGIVHAIEFYRQAREREAQAARLAVQLSEARIQALAAQLQPHFLFNTIQGVSTLMYRDVRAADAMLSRLSDLLRRTFQQGDRHEVTLAEELETLGHYIEIARTRFQDRLTIDVSVPAELHEALVPAFILQPIVENALEHGIARRAGAGHVTITATRDAGHLRLTVTDDGAGMRGADRFPVEGIGLGNTRERLRELYGEDQSLELEAHEPNGLRVTAVVPLRTAPVPA
jgi:signal transduction histidine kinase